jgi:hypothetical protein
VIGETAQTPSSLSSRGKPHRTEDATGARAALGEALADPRSRRGLPALGLLGILPPEPTPARAS